MNYLLLFIALCCAILSCNDQKRTEKQKSFKTLDFSYNDVFSTCFSIKFTHGDTVFIRQHFASAFSDTPKSNTTYYALLDNSERTQLDSFLIFVNFLKFDTLYYQSYQDGLVYQFYFDNGTTQKLIRIHSDSVPMQLETFRRWIFYTKRKLLLHRIDTVIDFESLKNFLPPSKIPPPTKFKTPTVE